MSESVTHRHDHPRNLGDGALRPRYDARMLHTAWPTALPPTLSPEPFVLIRTAGGALNRSYAGRKHRREDDVEELQFSYTTFEDPA